MKPLIIVAGPTATGKTKTAVSLAKIINGEIISADSVQVYKGMDIGSAKATVVEQEGVKHHLINVLKPDEPCSIARFQHMVKEAISDIYSRGKLPILTGGTGFYIQSIVYDITFEKQDKDHTYRNSLEEIARNGGTDVLYDMLMKVDEPSTKTIHRNNVKRVIRALEYYQQTGEPISTHNTREKEKSTPYNLAFYVLTMDRDILYKRIDQRVDKMFDEGLVKEVENLMKKGYSEDLVSMQALGYKEIIRYLNGDDTLEHSKEIIKRDTRRFAKRQTTWFKREKNVKWLDLSEYNYNIEKLVNIIVKDIEEKQIM